MADGKMRIYSLPEVTEVNSDMYIMLDSSATGTRKYNLKTMYDKVDGVEGAAEAAEAATETATTAAASATNAASAATSAASSAQSTVQQFMADATETMDGLVEDVNDAIEAMGDISEIAVPLMSPTTRGGAKVGHGLTVEDGALGIGEVTDPTDAGPIVELTAKGWATQDGTPSPDYPQEVRRCVGRNLLDLSDYSALGHFLLANGHLTDTNNNYNAYRNVLDVTGGNTYVVSAKVTSANANYRMQIYNVTASENITSSITSTNIVMSFTAPSNSEVELRVYGTSSTSGSIDLYDVQLELGTVPTPYVPYGHVGVEVQGRNLLDPSTPRTEAGSGITVTAHSDGTVAITGTSTASTYLNCFAMNVVLPAGTYTLSDASGRVYSANINLRLRGIPESESSETYLCYLNNGTSATFTLSKTTTITKLAFWVGASGVATNFTAYPQIEAGSTAHAYEPYYHATIPIPLPSRGWVAGLPDGTCDTLTLDGAGGYVWEMATRMTTQAVTDGVTGTVGVDVMSSTGQIADGATVLYKGATTTESGYVSDMPTVPAHASISCPDLADLSVRCCADEGAAEIASAWGKRYESRIAALEDAVATLIAGA